MARCVRCLLCSTTNTHELRPPVHSRLDSSHDLARVRTNKAQSRRVWRNTFPRLAQLHDWGSVNASSFAHASRARRTDRSPGEAEGNDVARGSRLALFSARTETSNA